MQTNHHYLRKSAITLTLVLLLISIGYIILIKVIDLDTYREQIIVELEKALKRPVSYKNGSLTFSLGPAITFHGISVKEPDNSADFVTIDNLTCRLDLLPLFRKEIVVHGLVADRPVINLQRHRDGTFNISDLMKSSSKDAPLKLHQIRIKRGDITFVDNFLQQDAVVTKLANTDLFLENLSRGTKSSFKLSTHLGGGASGALSVNGKIRIASKDSPLTNSTVDAKVSAKQLESGHFWPYYRQYVPFRKIFGVIDTEAEFHGRLKEFTTSGKIALHMVRFDYQPIFRQALTPKSIKLKYSLDLNGTDIAVKAIEADIDGAEVKGSCAIRDYRSGDPRITAQAVSSQLDFGKFKQYIPYGIIVKDTADWIEQHITGGIYQLDEGRLDGRVSQILHMESGENYNILYIRARAEKGIVSHGSKVPTFNNVKGILEMKGKDFFLHKMSGNFGNAPMTLEGSITDYPLDKPSGYPFRMTISPGKSEIAWLLGKKLAANFSSNGSSSLTLAGDGFTSGYNLSGEWNLSPAAYSYANLVTKPAGTASVIKFKGSISPKEAQVKSLNYTLGGLALDLSAKYPFETKLVDLQLNTNTFSLENIAPLSPQLNRYQPSGRIQLSVRGTQKDSTADDFKWRGAATLNNAAFIYAQGEKPVSALTGSINFADNAVETSQLSARIGNTLLTGKGAISSLNPVVFSTTFAAPQIDLADFGFKVPPKPVRITKVKGDLSFRENSLVIKTLSGSLNSSQLNIKGNVSDFDNLKADLAISAAYLDIADLLILKGLEKSGVKAAKSSVSPALKLVITADRGIVNGTSFEKLNTTLNLANNTLLFQPLEAAVLGGKLSAKGKFESLTASPHYQVDFKLANASAGEIVHLLAEKREVTGLMSLEGDLSAKGEETDALKKSAAGTLRIHATRGTLHRFSGLSKVFSILNVSQLFKFKLPDMVSEGMPYTDIRGAFLIKDGAVSTSDMFVASNAMNMSLVGKYDFIADNLDFTLGVQPLQTVDKVVSHIPIVGWILTGKEKSLISTYFEIKGKSANPNVSAIPVKGLGKGVLGIFKRVFQLPAKLFTDTGEVILGN